MDILEKIKAFRLQRGWSIYKLSLESGISANTIHNWYQRQSIPTISLLTQICEAFGITVSDFFAEHELIEFTPELRILVDKWHSLTKEERAIVQTVIDGFIRKKS